MAAGGLNVSFNQCGIYASHAVNEDLPEPAHAGAAAGTCFQPHHLQSAADHAGRQPHKAGKQDKEPT